MNILGLILIGTGIIILFVAKLVLRQVPRDYDYDSDDGFLDLLKMTSDILNVIGYIGILIGIIFNIIYYI